MSSNPTGDILIKYFLHSLFGDVFFHVLYYYFLRIVCLFVCFDFLCVFCCIVFVFFFFFFFFEKIN